MSENFEIILKIAAGAGSLIAIWIASRRFFYEKTIGNKKNRREQYYFAKDFLTEKALNPNLHPFVLEKGYQVIAEDRPIERREIEYLLDFKYPLTCLNNFIYGRKYLTSLDQSNDGRIGFLGIYKLDFLRTCLKNLWIVSYFLCVFLAIFPFLFSSFSEITFAKKFLPKASLPQLSILFAFSVAIYWSIAWAVLNSLQRLRSAERLVNAQKSALLIINTSAGNGT